jgi:hypothetical protein
MAMPEARSETMKSASCAVLAAAISLVVALPATTKAGGETFPLECAQRDVQLVTQMEQYGEAQSVPGELLYEAFWTMKRARDACAEGRVMAGLALYDSIFKTSLAGWVLIR